MWNQFVTYRVKLRYFLKNGAKEDYIYDFDSNRLLKPFNINKHELFDPREYFKDFNLQVNENTLDVVGERL